MANGHGGPRTPSNPAPVSGPGALSQRTDGAQPIRELPDAAYGEGKTFREAQQGAPLAESAALSPGGAGPGGGMGTPPAVPGLGDGSNQPGIPVTAGAALGAGPGVEALGLSTERDDDMATLQAYLPALEMVANQPGASWAARNYIRQIKGSRSMGGA